MKRVTLFLALLALLVWSLSALGAGNTLIQPSGSAVLDSTVWPSGVERFSLMAFLPDSGDVCSFLIAWERNRQDSIPLVALHDSAWVTLWYPTIPSPIDSLRIIRSDSLVVGWFVPHAQLGIQ